jgi:hypothetical protein
MPLFTPQPDAATVEAFRRAMHEADAVSAALSASDIDFTADPPLTRIPEKFWLLGSVPVERLPDGHPLDEDFLSALKVRALRFFVGLDDGGHIECDWNGSAIVSSLYVPPGADSSLAFLGRALLLWTLQAEGDNKARIAEFRGLGIRCVRVIGSDPGAVLDETWEGGLHGAPMTEADFVAHVLSVAAESIET